MTTQILLFIILFLVFSLIPAPLSAQSVENIKFYQNENDQVVITYDIVGCENTKFDVELWLSQDGGQHFDYQPISVSGDVSEGVTDGKNKQIVWDVLSDIRKLGGTSFVFKIILINEYTAIGDETKKSDYVENHKKRKHPDNYKPIAQNSGAVLRSLVLPGLGQYYKDQLTKGLLFTSAAVGAGIYIFINEKARRSAMDDYEEAYARYRDATSLSELYSSYDDLVLAANEAIDKRKSRDKGLYILAGVWALNLIDAAVGWPSTESGIEIGSVRLTTNDPTIAISIKR
jgi:hypothetical protein